MDRDLRQMEGMVEDMRRRNDPLTAHYERQTLIVKTRKEQLGDMYCGYAAAVSVWSNCLRDIMCSLLHVCCLAPSGHLPSSTICCVAGTAWLLHVSSELLLRE